MSALNSNLPTPPAPPKAESQERPINSISLLFLKEAMNLFTMNYSISKNNYHS